MTSITKIRMLTLQVFVLVFSASAAGQSTPAPADDSGAQKAGAITGRVTNESGQPIFNAAVMVRTVGSPTASRSTTTAADGIFQVSDLQPALYSVSAFAPSYTVGPPNPDSPQPVYYRPGDSVSITLIKGGVITGIVSTGNGEPVVSISVRALLVRDSNGNAIKSALPVMTDRTTDDRGVYRMYGVRPGTYLIVAGGRAASNPFSLGPYDTDVPIYSPGTTRDGAAEITVRAGEEVTGADIHYRSEPGHMVSGKAKGPVDPNSPGNGFSVTLSSSANSLQQPAANSYQAPNSDGFVFYGVGDGDYDIRAMSSLGQGEYAVSEPRHVKVQGNDVTGLELVASPLGSIAGRLTLEAGTAAECKDKRRPVNAETTISTRRNEQDNTIDGGLYSGGTSMVDPEGAFRIRNLNSGRYTLSARFVARYWYLKSISQQSPTVARRAAPIDLTHNWLNLRAGEKVAGVDITLAEGGASLRGKVTNAAEEKLPQRLVVYLVPVEREHADDLLRFFAASVAVDGTMSISNIAPGHYRIWAQVFDPNSAVSKFRLPDGTEGRAILRRNSEAG